VTVHDIAAWGWRPQVNLIAQGYITTSNTEALRADPIRRPQIRGRIPRIGWGDPKIMTARRRSRPCCS
jgi:NAD(P)-dependent dehydrogenase (short-subunit alcohol dehydrogenase family)